MSDTKGRIDRLAELVEEFSLDSAVWSGKGWKVGLSRTQPPVEALPVKRVAAQPQPAKAKKEKKPAAVVGKPISSPMMGIYYGSPSPGSEPFVKVGSIVQVGDVVGLIEAMKVFNEITSPFTGVVLKTPMESGQLVQPGDVLVLVE